MTVTMNGSSVDHLMDKARALVTEQRQIPSKTAIQKTLRVRFDRASEIHERLSDEQRRQRRLRRAALRRLGVRKNPNRVVPAPSVALPAAAPVVFPNPVVEPDAVPVGAVREVVAEQAVEVSPAPSRRVATWPLQLIALPAYVAIWAGWVALGALTGFGPINLLPGIGSGLTINTAITLPVGAEAYAAYAMYVLFHAGSPARARRFAAWSAGSALAIGMAGQVAYHLMAADGMTVAPWQITTAVSCLPVAVLGAAAALVHLVRAGHNEKEQ